LFPSLRKSPTRHENVVAGPVVRNDLQRVGFFIIIDAVSESSPLMVAEIEKRGWSQRGLARRAAEPLENG
jgi:hypothetical protein